MSFNLTLQGKDAEIIQVLRQLGCEDLVNHALITIAIADVQGKTSGNPP